MSKSDWPVRYTRAIDGVELAIMTLPGAAPSFLVLTPPGTPGRASSSSIPSMTSFCAAFLRENACSEFDWRGVGLSGGFKQPLTVEDLVADIAAVAGTISGPFYLLAFGATWIPAIQFAAEDRPRRLLALILENPRMNLPFRGLPEMPDVDYDLAITSHLRTIYDFPEGMVARDALLTYRREIRHSVIDAWSAITAEAEFQTHRSLAVPTLVVTDEGMPRWGTGLPSSSNLREVMVKPHPYNATRGSLLRALVDEFVGSPVIQHRGVQREELGLSAREMDVLRLVVEGRSNRDIAATLCLSEATIATHVRHILEKTGCANRTEVASMALRRGLLNRLGA